MIVACRRNQDNDHELVARYSLKLDLNGTTVPYTWHVKGLKVRVWPLHTYQVVLILLLPKARPTKLAYAP